jgi:hypothetical protein
MNLRKIFAYGTGFVAMCSVLVGCNGGSSRNTPNTSYGQFISGGNSQVNALWAGLLAQASLPPGNVIPMALMSAAFPSVAINTATSEATFQQANNTYVNTAPIFGMSAGESVGNYVGYQATNAGVAAAKFDTITYTTPGAPYMFTGGSTFNETVSGLVVMPLNSTGTGPLAPSQIKGVVLYYHPTVLSKAGVPSGYGNATVAGGSTEDESATFYSQFLLASIYASDGYIVIAPDYVGQGINTAPVHPYVMFPQTNALSGIYMLSALDTYLQESYGINLASIGHPNLYISSYSEGGGYALKAAQLISGSYANIVQNTGLTLKRTVGGSGAYDLTHQMLPFAFADAQNQAGYSYPSELNAWNVSPGCDPSVSGSLCLYSAGYAQSLAQYQLATSKPPLAAYMVNALVTYDYTPAAYNLVLVPPYASQTTCLNPASISLSESFATTNCSNIFGDTYSVMNLFSTVGLNQTTIGTQLFLSAAGNSSSGNGYFISNSTQKYTDTLSLLTALNYGVATNSIDPFVQQSLLNDYGIMTLVGNADTYNVTTTTPVSLLSLKYDSTVTNLNYMSACGMLGNNGSIHQNSPDLVTCNQIDNTNLWADVSLAGLNLPIYMNHGNAEAIMQIAAHNQMVTNPAGN